MIFGGHAEIPYVEPLFRRINFIWLPHAVRRICGKQKIVVFLTLTDGICRIISNSPPKSIF